MHVFVSGVLIEPVRQQQEPFHFLRNPHVNPTSPDRGLKASPRLLSKLLQKFLLLTFCLPQHNLEDERAGHVDVVDFEHVQEFD